MEKKYYIYLFLDSSKPGEYIYDDIKLEYEPFYVGKGCGDRIKSSLFDRESPFKVNKIKSLRDNKIEIISIKLFENLENEESLEIEKDVIKKIGRRDLKLGPLTNLTDGGDGRLTSPHSDDVKKKISDTKKSQALSFPHTEETRYFLRLINLGENNPMFGKTHTDEFKENQSLRVGGNKHPMFGKKHSESTINKIKENRFKNVDQNKLNELSRKRNNKPILQYDLDGVFIKEHESIKICALNTGLSESLIGKTCRGVLKNPKKFKFMFKDSDSSILNNSFKYKVGDIINIDNKEYILVKRNKKTCILSIEDELLNFRKNDYIFLWDKKSI